ncbi:hypothetical protein HBI56_162970 [Parastagonospora nodorum]|uniref:Uncharacterized protein n=2 Tax=Phaeosphaeria nodorum (strain SN15 / ATCC MYA-4574 / FGSC 10173) TaxID=321614 RepID=A0A7U2NPN6_PHANO|nr:hypothetical protein SNOG_13313 [Parastagonospora nodorum SN15]KAH3911570.1 hypothetical protein HBH56_125250 [Parastagonospora nodorum]EAT79197.1 hypothetical protein SNOG_13313 [Parastagonospora nodorum SN15]KAH3931286.1 hypothetical protein HBH54_098260 [Parastagonospora nodorum]KAH3944264.1 hypothetical protein HBH53_159730 [Parastagonospora nodorum]KAH3956884.1 hypothetical protein HBH51_233560 [Parastagonospora nodorum]
MPPTFKHVPLEEYLHLDQYIPRPLDEARLAELKALCYDDELQRAYVVLQQHHVYMYFSKHQSELELSDAIKRVLRSLDEKTLEAQKLRAKLEGIEKRIEKRIEEKETKWLDENGDHEVAGDHVPTTSVDGFHEMDASGGEQ